MEDTTELLTVESIRNCVYMIRGQQVMLDSDLADIYGYELKAMNQQVKRNIERFPEDFMFQLKQEEIPSDYIKSQFVTLNESGNKRGLHIKKMPYAFTEQGIYMLATVLKGDLAVQQSIFIMRAFKEMRHYIRQNQQFVTQSEMSMVTAKVSELSVQMAGAIDHQKKTDKAIEDIQKSIDTLNENFVSDKDFKNLKNCRIRIGIFIAGQLRNHISDIALVEINASGSIFLLNTDGQYDNIYV